MAGGALHSLNGNHETMSVQGNFKYATDAGAASARPTARVWGCWLMRGGSQGG